MRKLPLALILLVAVNACGLSAQPTAVPSTDGPPPSPAAPATKAPVTLQASPTATAVSALTADVVVKLGEPEGVIRPLLGVNLGPLPQGDAGNVDLTERYQQSGVTQIRTHDYYGPLDMATLYPDQNADPADPSSYDFEASDRFFAAVLAGGFEPYLRLGDSYNATDGYPKAEPRAPTNPRNWVRAAVEVVRHYRDLAGGQLRYVEIWNEPDNTQFWDGDRRAFFSLFTDAAIALKTEFPDLKIGGPGLTPAGALSPQGQAFTRGLLDAAQARNAPLDFFSWHMYSNDPDQYRSAARFYRTELDQHGYTAAESHITEWNTADRDQASGLSPETVRLGGQGAAILSAAWIALQDEGVAVSTFYRGPDPTLDLPTFYGLFFADGRPKRSGLVFGLWAQLVAHPERLPVIVDPGSGLWVIAGRNAAGELAVLMVNPTATTHVWQLADLAGQAVVYEVSDASEAAVESRLSGDAAAIGAYTTQLLVVGP